MSEGKVCVVCAKYKKLGEFYRRSNDTTQLRAECRECTIQRSKRWRLAHPEQYRELDKRRHYRSLEKRRKKERDMYAKRPSVHRDKHLRTTYGITEEEFNRIFEMQGNKCAICGTTTCTDGRKFHVDHNHASGVIRGILCNNCNLMLGLVHDNPTVLTQASQYLIRTDKQK